MNQISKTSTSLFHNTEMIKEEVAKLRLTFKNLQSTYYLPESHFDNYTNQAPHQAHLHNESPKDTLPTITPTCEQSCICIGTWNCRGMRLSVPYIQSLLNEDIKILILTNQWVWSHHLHELDNIHPRFLTSGCCDRRLHEQAKQTRGCGGVGILWYKPQETSSRDTHSKTACVYPCLKFPQKASVLFR